MRNCEEYGRFYDRLFLAIEASRIRVKFWNMNMSSEAVFWIPTFKASLRSSKHAPSLFIALVRHSSMWLSQSILHPLGSAFPVCCWRSVIVGSDVVQKCLHTLNFHRTPAYALGLQAICGRLLRFSCKPLTGGIQHHGSLHIKSVLCRPRRDPSSGKDPPLSTQFVRSPLVRLSSSFCNRVNSVMTFHMFRPPVH